LSSVLKNLVDGLSEIWVRVGRYWLDLCKSSITEARQRVGCLVLLIEAGTQLKSGYINVFVPDWGASQGQEVVASLYTRNVTDAG